MNKLASRSKIFLKQNSSTILTCVGAAGVVATAISAAVATPKALSLLQKAREEKNDELTPYEKVKTATPAYIPPLIIGASTIACIFGANILNKRQQAALTSAYALLDSSYKTYRKKVKEIHGVEGDMKVLKSMESDKYEEINQAITSDRIIFFDYFSLRLFESSLDDICKAEKRVNDLLKRYGHVSLADFYNELGVSCCDSDYQIGWSELAGAREGYDHIEFIVEKIKGEERYVLTMSAEPTIDYLYF